MGHRTVQCWEEGLWALIGRQHGVVSRRQLLERGVGAESIKHRIGSGRLFPLHRGVYAAGRPWLGPLGEWMAAVLACGPGAVLSHRSAGQLWGLVEDPHAAIELSAPVAGPSD